MKKFVASNGIPIKLTDDRRLIVENSDHTYPTTVAQGDHVDALREFFAWEATAKPWHDAKPGEIWALDIQDSETTGFRAPFEVLDEGHTRFRDIASGMTYGYRAAQITAGVRIWPHTSEES